MVRAGSRILIVCVMMATPESFVREVLRIRYELKQNGTNDCVTIGYTLFLMSHFRGFCAKPSTQAHWIAVAGHGFPITMTSQPDVYTEMMTCHVRTTFYSSLVMGGDLLKLVTLTFAEQGQDTMTREVVQHASSVQLCLFVLDLVSSNFGFKSEVFRRNVDAVSLDRGTKVLHSISLVTPVGHPTPFLSPVLPLPTSLQSLCSAEELSVTSSHAVVLVRFVFRSILEFSKAV